ncbi:MAG TPA: CaiB/BaiF CoA-transferase family protein [Deltaproteobacteria bacterium]|nr:CaiB/BaiF CoA-transferase family protein [Deltaproteobacteria bacterium]
MKALKRGRKFTMSALLEGIRILDFTYLLPGPFATMMLSDLGAEVLRVESPSRIDMARLAPPFVDKDGQISCMHATLSRNKKSIALDLKNPWSIDIIKRLIREKGYTIVVEQFRPGAMDRLGLSYEKLCECDQGLIYCSITGYGQTGPLRDRAGHDINYLALSGVMSYSGRNGCGPCQMGIQVADVGSGSNNAVIGILAAVIHRMKTGEGQYIDISMTDGMFPHHVVSGIRALVGDTDPCFESELLNGASIYGFYETSDGKYLSCGGLEPQFLTAFLQTLGLGDYVCRLMEPGITEELREKVADTIRSRPRNYWIEVFSQVDACVEPVLSFTEAAGSEHAKARGLVVNVPGPDGKPIPQIGLPISFSGYAPEYRWAGTRLGSHTDEVLRSLDISDDEIEGLKKKGIIM